LDTEITHYEFFLGKKPVNKIDWSDDKTLLAAIPELSGCMHGWPSKQVFDCNYQLVNLSNAEFEFLQGCVPPPAHPYRGEKEGTSPGQGKGEKTVWGDFGGCGDGIGWSAIDLVKTANFANTEIIGLLNYLNEPRRREVREGRTASPSFSCFASDGLRGSFNLTPGKIPNGLTQAPLCGYALK